LIDNDELNRIAFTDELTGRRNRNGLNHDYFGTDLRGIHFIYVDIDDFNKMVVVFGEDAIDYMLKCLGETLLNYCGKSDVYRVGVDQFLMITDSHIKCEPDGLHKLLRQPIIHSNIQILINASICVVDYDDLLCGDLTDIMKLMHFAIDESKQTSRNALIYADEELKRRFLEKRDVERSIYDAVKNDCFFAKFHPFVDTFHNEIIGFEAVSRWRQKHRVLKPDKYLLITEYTGLIYDIEMKMFEEAVQFYRELNDDKSIRLSQRFNASLNFSAFTLRKVSIKDLSFILDKYKVFPKNIIIEIKESIITDTDVYKKIIELSEAGFLIALDEYSNNNSSLTYLVDLKVDILKLDESLLDKIDNHQEYTSMHSIYKFIVDIGKKFNLTIVSTGIKKKEHLKLVRDLEINVGSGSYFSRAVGKKAFISLLNPKKKKAIKDK